MKWFGLALGPSIAPDSLLIDIQPALADRQCNVPAGCYPWSTRKAMA
jgi:hypothetical protein